MKKDYSKKNIINTMGLSLPNIICYIGSLIISLLIKIIFNIKDKITFFIFIIIESFIGLQIAGKLLEKNCINKDIKKCKKCKNWNCCREIKK